MNEIREQIEWLGKEAQRHSQSASDLAFTSRRRATFKHRAKKLRDAADTMGKLLAVYDAADVALHSDVIGSNPENIDRLAEAVAAVQTGQTYD